MTQRDDQSSVRPEGQAPPGHDGEPSLTVARLATQVAELSQRPDAPATDASAGDPVGGSHVCTLQRLAGAAPEAGSAAPAVPTPRRAPQQAPGRTQSRDDVVAEAARLSGTWIVRARQCQLRTILLRLEEWATLLEEVVSTGQLPNVPVEQIIGTDECSSGRWLRSNLPDELDPVRAATARKVHDEHHRLAALILAEVAAGRRDEARRLLEAEDGFAGVARTLEGAVKEWIDVLAFNGQEAV